jgi:hypothetical protein
MESLPGYDAWKTRAPDMPDACEYCGEEADVCDCYCRVCGYTPCGCDEIYENWRDRKWAEEAGEVDE